MWFSHRSPLGDMTKFHEYWSLSSTSVVLSLSSSAALSRQFYVASDHFCAKVGPPDTAGECEARGIATHAYYRESLRQCCFGCRLGRKAKRLRTWTHVAFGCLQPPLRVPLGNLH